MTVSAPTDRFLNVDPSDPALTLVLDAMVLEGGALTLAPVHSAAGGPGAAQEGVGALRGPAGIGVGPSGELYVADPPGNRILRIEDCETVGRPLPCLDLDLPRGVAVLGRTLYIADSGHQRIVLVDVISGGVSGTWDGFGDPWDVAVDGEQRVYVADHGTSRIDRFDRDGNRDPTFGDAVAAGDAPPRAPSHVLAAVLDGEERIAVLDEAPGGRIRLLVFGTDGRYLPAVTGEWRRRLADRGVRPDSLTAGAGALYVSEAATGRILSFSTAGDYLGEARGYAGGGAGLVLDASGRLVVNAGNGGATVLGTGSPAAAGSFVLGPIAAAGGAAWRVVWQRLRVAVDPLADGAHLRMFVLSSADRTAPPPLPADPGLPPLHPAPPGTWAAAPLDATDLLAEVEPAEYLWVGGQLRSGSAGAPVIRRIRVDFDDEGWLRHLPAVYTRPTRSLFLERTLELSRDALDDEERLIDDLPTLFEPAAAPAGWLDWLAGWLAFPLEPTLTDEGRRGALAEAFTLQSWRGTAEGLRRLLEIELGVEAAITGPSAPRPLWALGADEATLGFGTSLAAQQPDGAVLGTTATLDSSTLLDEQGAGAPAYAGFANRICVNVYAAGLGGRRADVERIVERERPAHVTAHVCVIEPRLRVGFQATVGVDAIVGRPDTPLRLDESGLLGADAALPDRPDAPLRTGARIRPTTTVT